MPIEWKCNIVTNTPRRGRWWRWRRRWSKILHWAGVIKTKPKKTEITTRYRAWFLLKLQINHFQSHLHIFAYAVDLCKTRRNYKKKTRAYHRHLSAKMNREHFLQRLRWINCLGCHFSYLACRLWSDGTGVILPVGQSRAAAAFNHDSICFRIIFN